MIRKLNWHKELIYWGLVGMETCWITALFVIFAGVAASSSAAATALVVGALILSSLYLVRTLNRFRVAPRFHWLAVTLGLFLASSLVLGLRLYPETSPDRPPTLIVLLVMSLVVLAWWRGSLLAQTDVASPNVVSFYFWIGLSVFLLLIILGHFMLGQTVVTPTIDVASAMDGVLGFIPIYFLLSPVIIGLSRIQEIVQMPESTAATPHTGYWLALLLSSAGGAIGIGWLLSSFYVGGGLNRSLSWTPPILKKGGQFLYRIIEVVATAIATALAYLLTPAIEWFESLGLAERLLQMLQTVAETLENVQQLVEERATDRGVSEGWAELWQWLFVVLAVLAVLAIGRAIRRSRQSSKVLIADVPEELASAWGVDKGANSLGNVLSRLRERLKQGLRFLYALSIRRIYSNLLRLAVHRGHKRRPAQTPYEFETALNEALPGHAGDIRIITRAYVRAHYGQVPDSREELRHIREAWQRIRTSSGSE